jgi:uncharacterized membrane protein
MPVVLDFYHASVLAETTALGAAVEAIEALTIVLAVGAARSWRSALLGAAAGFAVLFVVTVVFGPLLAAWFTNRWVALVAGALLCYVGFIWLRKSILRFAGRKALHDENVAYNQAFAEVVGGGTAWLAAFSAVVFEGMEIVLMVFGIAGASGPAGVAWSGAGALGAVLVVVLVGCAVRKPLARIPENAMKCVVGILLAAFGTFWLGEGLLITWPLGEAFLLIIIAVYALAALLCVSYLRR